jgi:phospholipid transport system substrate-binding protein
MNRFFKTLSAMMLLALANPSHAMDVAGAKNFLDQVAADVLSIVRDERASKEQKQQRIETIFSDKVDISFVAKFVLGKHWRTASPAQQKSYVAAYEPFILKNYAGKLVKYSGQTYRLKSPYMEDNVAVVTMEIIDPSGTNVNVDYRLGDAGAGKYKINDIVIEGVSLLATQRAEFDSIVQNKGVDGLIAALRTQVASK